MQNKQASTRSSTCEPHVRVSSAVFLRPTAHVNTAVTYLQLGLKQEEICHFPVNRLSFQHGRVPSAGGASLMDPMKRNN